MLHVSGVCAAMDTSTTRCTIPLREKEYFGVFFSFNRESGSNNLQLLLLLSIAD